MIYNKLVRHNKPAEALPLKDLGQLTNVRLQ
jgi:hypothetical protein